MSKILKDFSRRSLFRSAGASLLLAPLLRAEIARAQNQPIKRFVSLFHPNGTMYSDNKTSPNGTETQFDFGKFYKPLEKHKAETIALTGMRVGGEPWGTQADSEGGHDSGGWACLTCTSSKNMHQAQGPSIDQFIARKMKEQGLAPTFKAPVYQVVESYPNRFYYEDANKPISPVRSPAAAYADLFGSVMTGPGTVSQRALALVARKKSVLDAAWNDCKGQLNLLPSDGRATLQYHCDRIRDLEMALQAPPPTTACTPPQNALTSVAMLDVNKAENIPALTDFFFKLMTTAFTCDLTRVASFAFGHPNARFNMPWLGDKIFTIGEVNTGEKNARDHHSHTHAGTEDSIAAFMTWYATKVSELLDLFKAPQPDGTKLLDSSLLHYTTEFGGADGAHGTWGLSMFIFTKLAGYRTGRLLAHPIVWSDYKSDTAKQEAKRHHAMMVSFIKSMGITGVDQFGELQAGSGPLATLA
jgi:Protein of unknown function (DUF1552)